MRKLTILSLCDHSGNWPAFYEPERYNVVRIDVKSGRDVRLLEHLGEPVHGILCAPPCTAFALSGAQYWPAKDADGRTTDGLAVVDACLRAVAIYRPAWWALENPIGRLRRWLGPPRYKFDPCDFGGWGDERDAYTKRTLLWGEFTPPETRPVEAQRVCAQGSWIQRLGGGGGERAKELRSVTPLGFARAYRMANP